MNTEWHFPVMILSPILIFFLVLRIILSKKEFIAKRRQIFILTLIVVVLGMLFGKYGATNGLPWWLYYPNPMLLTAIPPPVILKLNTQKTVAYLVLHFHFFGVGQSICPFGK